MTPFELALAPAAAAGCAVFFAKWLNQKIQMRHLSNVVLAAADEEFFSAANKMLKTPDDIPDSVIDLLEMMSRTGFERGSEKAFLRALQASRQDKCATDTALESDIEGMRGELRTLFLRATAAWFNIMTHKDSRHRRLIAIEACRSKLSASHGMMSDASVGIPVASHMLPNGCAA